MANRLQLLIAEETFPLVIGLWARGGAPTAVDRQLGDGTILEVDVDRMRFLHITLRTAHSLYSTEVHLLELLPDVDLLIGAVLVHGAKAPKLIQCDMLRRMRPGSVLVDTCTQERLVGGIDDRVHIQNGDVTLDDFNVPGAGLDRRQRSRGPCVRSPGRMAPSCVSRAGRPTGESRNRRQGGGPEG